MNHKSYTFDIDDWEVVPDTSNNVENRYIENAFIENIYNENWYNNDIHTKFLKLNLDNTILDNTILDNKILDNKILDNTILDNTILDNKQIIKDVWEDKNIKEIIENAKKSWNEKIYNNEIQKEYIKNKFTKKRKMS
jgi:uncharacterized protein YjbI with pentapeptide repeats